MNLAELTAYLAVGFAVIVIAGKTQGVIAGALCLGLAILSGVLDSEST